MLSPEENQALTLVGPGTPAGDLLRRYWMPIGAAAELTPASPTKFVRVLGEDLVLFRDGRGRVGLLADHCAHRGASLLYGRVEERGIACAYHGWLYDTSGNCLECPAEPAGSRFHMTVKQTAYPVQEFSGLLWAYLGPAPTPVIPRYDVFMRKDGRRRIVVQPTLDCNWFQTMENAADPVHADVLHYEPHQQRGVRITNSTRGNVDDIQSYTFYRVPYGLMKKRVHRDGTGNEHPLIFPNGLRVGNTIQIRTPVDDSRTMVFRVVFEPTPDGSLIEDEGEIPVEYTLPYKDPPSALYPSAHYFMRIIDVAGYGSGDWVQAQDYMAWETQGQNADRTSERLATSDRGIVMLREMMREQIELVQQGRDPLGIVRDPDHAIIDTNLDGDTVPFMRAGIPVGGVSSSRSSR
ncbi:MAG TPA: Rieske 2Fe-2S domain-containing protein [Chloroflexota bacterium]|nr:Rieske 2Fe-2S domain-containing protein [Chloroflexota bacterium]